LEFFILFKTLSAAFVALSLVTLAQSASAQVNVTKKLNPLVGPQSTVKTAPVDAKAELSQPQAAQSEAGVRLKAIQLPAQTQAQMQAQAKALEKLGPTAPQTITKL